MAKQFDFTEHGASVILDRDDAQEILADLPEGEVVEVSAMTFQAGKRLARLLVERGWEIKGDEEEEAPKPKAKKAKKPRDPSAPPKLTKKRVNVLADEYNKHRLAGESIEASLSLLSEAHGYPVAKLRKALGITEGEE